MAFDRVDGDWLRRFHEAIRTRVELVKLDDIDALNPADPIDQIVLAAEDWRNMPPFIVFDGVTLYRNDSSALRHGPGTEHVFDTWPIASKLTLETHRNVSTSIPSNCWKNCWKTTDWTNH